MTVVSQHASVRARILVADDETQVRELLRQVLGRAGHTVVEAGSVVEARAALTQDSFELLLCDIGMPDGSGLELVEEVAAELPDMAVMMVTAVDDPSVAEAAFAMGAHAYLVKPFTRGEVLINVGSALRRRELERARRFHVDELQSKVLDRTFALRQAVKRLDDAEATVHGAEQETVDRLLAALALRRGESRAQVERVGFYAALLAERARVTSWPAEQFRVATMLHDVGEIGVPDSILLKPGRLTSWEFEVVKRHPVTGSRLLSEGTSSVLVLAAQIARTHHERWDGRGYPHGLTGLQIPVEGRIVAIADAYDALTSRRVYRPGVLDAARAMEVLRIERERQFDPDLLDIFACAVDDIAEIGAEHPERPAIIANVRVLVAEQSGMFRDALCRVVASDSGMELVGTAGTVREARAVASDEGAEVVVLGATFPDGSGLDAARMLRADGPGPAVVLLVDDGGDTEVGRAVEAGCAGWVVRRRAADDLLPAIRAVGAGESLVLAPRLVSILPTRVSPTEAEAEAEAGPRPDAELRFTADEMAVLQLMAGGLSEAAVAERLELSADTVAGLVNQILSSLHARSRLEAVVTAACHGIIGKAPTQAEVDAHPVPVGRTLMRVPIPLALVDPSSRQVIEVNAAFALLVGSDPSRLRGVDVLSLTNSEQRTYVESVISGLSSRVIDSCYVRSRLVRADGTEIPTQAWIGRRRPDPDDRVLLAVVPGSEDSVVTLPSVLEPGAECAVLGTVDHDWRWHDISGDAAEHIGWDAETLTGTPLLSTVHSEDVSQLLLALGRSAAERRGVVTRLRVLGRDRRPTVVQCEVSPLCRHVPPRFGLALRRVETGEELETIPQRVSRLEQHLWRIAVEVQGMILGHRASGTEGWWAHPAMRELSPKQLEVVVRVLQGSGTPDIARSLSLSPSTVRNHLAVVYRKFGVHSRSELFALLTHSEWVDDATDV